MSYFIGKKKPEYYDGLLVKADLGLHQQIAELIQVRVPSGGSVLDLGAGEGALSARLADLGFLMTSVDKDAGSFRCHKATFEQLDFDLSEQIQGFVSRHDSMFDAVLGIEVIEHVHDQWQYVRQLMKMVKPGGLILITTPNTTSWLSRMMFLLRGRFHQFGDADLSYGHVSPISPWELELILKSEGAEAIEIRPAGTLPAVYVNGSLRLLVMNMFALLLRPFSSGILDGWCVMAIARKPG